MELTLKERSDFTISVQCLDSRKVWTNYPSYEYPALAHQAAERLARDLGARYRVHVHPDGRISYRLSPETGLVHQDRILEPTG